MINANNNISQSSERLNNMPDSSQSRSADSNSFATKLDRILKKYKKTNDDIIRNQRDAQLRIEKAAVEEESSEAARIAMAFTGGAGQKATEDPASSTECIDKVSFEKIAKSVKKKLNGLANSDESSDTNTVSISEDTTVTDAQTELSAMWALGNAIGSNGLINISGSKPENAKGSTSILADTLNGQSAKGNAQDANKATEQSKDAKSDGTKQTGGISLKDLERILNESGLGKVVADGKTEKTTADVGTGRQLPNVTFKKFEATIQEQSTVKSTETGPEASTDTTIAGTIAKPGKEIITDAKPTQTAAKSKTDDTDQSESANISTSKVNNQKSENNNPQFSAGNGDKHDNQPETIKISIKLSTNDSAVLEQSQRAKNDLSVENVQRNQELKNTDIKEFSNTVLNLARNTENNSTNSLTMRLTPDSLGTLIVEVGVEGDAARISIKADTQEAVRAIEEQMPALKERLEAQGLKLEQAEVSHYTQEDSSGQSFTRDKERREDDSLRRAFIRTSGRSESTLHEDQE